MLFCTSSNFKEKLKRLEKRAKKLELIKKWYNKSFLNSSGIKNDLIPLPNYLVVR